MSEIIKFDGFDLDDPSAGYIIDEGFEWLDDGDISFTKEAAGGLQGVFASPSYVRGRTVRINGLIRALSDTELQDKADILKKIFSVPWNPTGGGTKQFYVQDSNGVEWVADAIIADGISFARNGTIGKYSVSIFMPDSRYRSLLLKYFPWQEGIIAGIALPYSFPFAYNNFAGNAVITTVGNVAAPLKITIIATGTIDTSINIINNTNGDYFAFNVTGVPGDVFVIDSGIVGRNVSITKNGSSILNQKLAGSTWLSVLGTMSFTAADADQSDDFTINYEFYDRLS